MSKDHDMHSKIDGFESFKIETGIDNAYQHLLQVRIDAVRAVNVQLIETYWQVGQHIVEFEQDGKIRAEYGKAVINRLAADLHLRHGKEFSRSNLIRIRQFYLTYQK